jgi:hypothetical protein
MSVQRPDLSPTAVESLLSQIERAIGREMFTALRSLRDALSLPALIPLIFQRSIRDVIDSVPWPVLQNALAQTQRRLATVRELGWRQALHGLPQPTLKLPDLQLQLGAHAHLKPDVQSAIQRQDLSRITVITEETREAIRERLVAGLAKGQPPADLARNLRDLIGLNRPQATALANFRAQLEAAGRDPAQIERMVARRSTRMLNQRARVIAGNECLPGSTRVDAAVVGAVFRRWYEGNIVEIVTRNGRYFSATPNHPMLTGRGWVGAGELDETDDLICDSGQQGHGKSAGPDVQRTPSTIREIFDALTTVTVPERHVGRKPDFHGDGCEGEVNIACANGELRIGDFAPIYKPLAENILTPTGMSGATFCPICGRLLSIDKQQCLCLGANCDSARPQSPKYQFARAPQGFGDRSDALATLVPGDEFGYRDIEAEPRVNPTPRKEEPLCLAVGSRDASSCDGVLYPGAIPASEGIGDQLASHSGKIEFDRVLSVGISPWSGHVYNLSTPYGYFTISGGIYTGNSMRALAEGRTVQWNRLVQEGHLASKDWEREWVTAGDERVCPICAPFHGARADIGGVFTSTEGESASGVPIHIVCRCIERLTLRDFRKGERPAPARDKILAEIALRRKVDAWRQPRT